MKRIAAVCAVLFVLICATTSMAAATKMRYLCDGDDVKYYLCADTLVVKPSGANPSQAERAQMWVYCEAAPNNTTKLACVDSLYEIAPGRRQIRLIEQSFTYKDGTHQRFAYLELSYDLIAAGNRETWESARRMSQWRNVPPGSIVETIYEAINKAYKREKSWFKLF